METGEEEEEKFTLIELATLVVMGGTVVAAGALTAYLSKQLWRERGNPPDEH